MQAPEAIELCLEELSDSSCDEPYVRCVAVAGGTPGLGFFASGSVLWRQVENTVAELWVSLDARLILYRTREDCEVVPSRAARQLELPLGKPVVALHGDEFAINGHRYRLHVHGLAAEARPPEPLRLKRSRAAVLGAAVALGAMGPACDRLGRNPIEVRDAPPSWRPPCLRQTLEAAPQTLEPPHQALEALRQTLEPLHRALEAPRQTLEPAPVWTLARATRVP